MVTTWDQRYAGKEYAYGKEPNGVFRRLMDSLVPGRLFLPGEGEGRNAVYAAGKGWEVTALDQSTEGRKKALALAAEKGVQISYHVGDLAAMPELGHDFDLISLVFVHLPPEIRERVHHELISMLKPGGFFHILAFTPEQLKHQSGGPRDIRLLYDAPLLRGDLASLRDLRVEAIDSHFMEGPFHHGRYEAIEVMGMRPLHGPA